MRGPLLLNALTSAARAVPLGTGYRLADVLSSGHRLLCPRRRAAVRGNLGVLRGEGEDLDPLLRVVFRNYGRYLFEFVRGPEIPEIPVRLEGQAILDAALARGRGVVLATVHTGNWEIAGARLARQGIPLHAVAGVQLTGAWTAELRRRQEAAGIRILPPSHTSRRAMVEVLRRNEVVALLCDGDLFRRGVEVPFCGRRVRLPAGPARLAAKTGAALVPAYCLRDPAGGLVASFLPEVPVAAGTEAAVRTATEELAERLGRVVATHPGQWLIFRDFFRNGNDGRLAVLGDAA